MRRLAVPVVVVAGVAAWLGFARPRWLGKLLPARPARNLLLVSIDTLRADRLGSYGYARGADAARSTLSPAPGCASTQATTVVPLTLPAHSSLLTGTFPAWHGVRDNGGFYLGDDQVTLAEVLRDEGLPHGRLRRRVRARPALGHRPGLRALLRRVRPREVRRRRRAWTPSSGRARRSWTRPSSGWARSASSPSSPGCISTIRTLPTRPPEPFRSRFPSTLPAPTTRRSPTTDAQVGRLLDALEPRRTPRRDRWSWWWATTARCWASTESRPTASSSTRRPSTSP